MKKWRVWLMVLFVPLLILGYGCSKKSTSPLESDAPTNEFVSITSNSKYIFLMDSSEDRIYAYDLVNDKIVNYKDIGGWAQDLKYIDGKIFGVSTQDNNIKVIDISTSAEQYIAFSAGSSPEFIAYDSNNLYVTLMNKNKVAVVSRTDYSIVKEIEVDSKPWGIYYYNGYVYVANGNWYYDGMTTNYETGTVSIIDASTLEVVKTINVGINPQQFVYNDGYIVLICAGNYDDISGEIDLIEPSTNSVISSQSITGAPIAITSKETGKVVVATSSWPGPAAIYEVDLAGLTITKKLDLSAGDLIMNTTDDKIYVSSGYSSTGPGYLWEVDANSYIVNDTITIGTSPTALSLIEFNVYQTIKR